MATDAFLTHGWNLRFQLFSCRVVGCIEKLLTLPHEEINRRTRVVRIFPNEASLLKLVNAFEMEISEDWIAGKRYLNMNAESENENDYARSGYNKI